MISCSASELERMTISPSVSVQCRQSRSASSSKRARDCDERAVNGPRGSDEGSLTVHVQFQLVADGALQLREAVADTAKLVHVFLLVHDLEGEERLRGAERPEADLRTLLRKIPVGVGVRGGRRGERRVEQLVQTPAAVLPAAVVAPDDAMDNVRHVEAAVHAHVVVAFGPSLRINDGQMQVVIVKHLAQRLAQRGIWMDGVWSVCHDVRNGRAVSIEASRDQAIQDVLCCDDADEALRLLRVKDQRGVAPSRAGHDDASIMNRRAEARTDRADAVCTVVRSERSHRLFAGASEDA
eukprot:scaffold1006_cov270-Pinguiococcus_pyrenoidosus.AAC.17